MVGYWLGTYRSIPKTVEVKIKNAAPRLKTQIPRFIFHLSLSFFSVLICGFIFFKTSCIFAAPAGELLFCRIDANRFTNKSFKEIDLQQNDSFLIIITLRNHYF